MAEKGDSDEDETYDLQDSGRETETDGGEETEESYELDFDDEEDSDEFADFDDDFDEEFGELDDDLDEEFGDLDDEPDAEEAEDAVEAEHDGHDEDAYGDLDGRGSTEPDDPGDDAEDAEDAAPEFDEEFTDDLSDDLKGDLADDAAATEDSDETTEPAETTGTPDGTVETPEPQESEPDETTEPRGETSDAEEEPMFQGSEEDEPAADEETPDGTGDSGPEATGDDLVDEVEDALGMDADETVESTDTQPENSSVDDVPDDEPEEVYGSPDTGEPEEPEETVETYGGLEGDASGETEEEAEAEPPAGDYEAPTTEEAEAPASELEEETGSDDDLSMEEPEPSEQPETYGDSDEGTTAEEDVESAVDKPDTEDVDRSGETEPVTEEPDGDETRSGEEGFAGTEPTAEDGVEFGDGDDGGVDDPGLEEPGEAMQEDDADPEADAADGETPEEADAESAAGDGEHEGDGEESGGPDAEGDGDSAVDPTLGTGDGEGVAVTGEGDLDALGDAMTEADEIADFFDDRTSGEGHIKEMEEVEGFFEPGNELEAAFGEDKLNTLLSEAKQGVAEYEGLEGYVEHERYWVNKPYAYVAILYSDTQNDHMYYVVEPRLDEYEQTVRQDLEERLRDVLMYEEVDNDLDEEEILEKKVKKIIRDYGIEIESDSMHKILYYLKRDYIHDGKIDPIMRDPGVEDISCDGDNVPIFVYHRDYRDLMSNVEFEKDDLDSFVIKLAQKAGKHISVADPLVDASMPDGSRIQMTLGTEVTDRGSTFTIRLFADEPFTPIDLINYNTFSLEQMAYLWTCIENNKSLIFAGGTASGKTTSMNAVTLFIPPKSKVISIEDTREITLPHMNWIPSVTRDSFSDDGVGAVDEYELLRAALRQRPEYLVVGEVRGEEALTLFQAMSTGHTTYSTMHADSVDSAIHRLENPPISVPRSMLKALDIVSIQSQTFVGGERVRRNMKLVEIIGIDPKTRNIRTDDIFQWNAETDNFVRTGNSTALQDIKRARGWSDEELQRELDERREVLQYMLDNDIAEYEDVSKIIQSFIIDRDRVLNQIREDEIDLEALAELKTLNL